MNKVFKRVELLTNIALIAVAIVLIAVLVKQFILTNRTDSFPTAPEVSPGDRSPVTTYVWVGKLRPDAETQVLNKL